MNLNRALKMAVGSLTLTALFCAGTMSVHAGQTPKTKMSSSQAEAAALKKYKSGKIQGKTELENEDGKWQYAVMVKVGAKMHEVMVNANTGKIESEETVTAKEEAAEKKAETAKKSGKMGKTGKAAKAAKPEAGEKGEKGEAGEKGEKGEKE